MEKDLKLVSGSDLRGVAVDLGSGVTLGPDQARSAAYAFAEFLKKRTGQSSPLVALGRDPRLTGEALLHAAAEGLCAAGARSGLRPVRNARDVRGGAGPAQRRRDHDHGLAPAL